MEKHGRPRLVGTRHMEEKSLTVYTNIFLKLRISFSLQKVKCRQLLNFYSICFHFVMFILFSQLYVCVLFFLFCWCWIYSKTFRFFFSLHKIWFFEKATTTFSFMLIGVGLVLILDRYLCLECLPKYSFFFFFYLKGNRTISSLWLRFGKGVKVIILWHLDILFFDFVVIKLLKGLRADYYVSGFIEKNGSDFGTWHIWMWEFVYISKQYLCTTATEWIHVKYSRHSIILTG